MTKTLEDIKSVSMLNKMKNLKSEIAKGIFYAACISLPFYGLPLVTSFIDKPNQVEIKDMNGDRRKDLVLSNSRGIAINPQKFGENVFYAINDSMYVSGKGTAIRRGDNLTINQFPYRPISLSLK